MYQFDLKLPENRDKKSSYKLYIIAFIIVVILLAIAVMIYKNPNLSKDIISNGMIKNTSEYKDNNNVVSKQIFLEVKNELLKEKKKNNKVVVKNYKKIEKNLINLKMENKKLKNSSKEVSNKNKILHQNSEKMKSEIKKLKKKVNSNTPLKNLKLISLRTLTCDEYKGSSSNIPSECKKKLDDFLNLYSKKNIFKITMLVDKKKLSIVDSIKNMDYALKLYYKVSNVKLDKLNSLATSGIGIDRFMVVMKYIKENLGNDTIVIQKEFKSKNVKKYGYIIKSYKY